MSSYVFPAPLVSRLVRALLEASARMATQHPLAGRRCAS
jgi:hypothetical protein